MIMRGQSEESARRSSRAQSATIGLILLIGVVAAGSIAILAVGGEMIGQTEQQAEQERIEQAFVELSHTMATAASEGDSTHTIEFDAGEKGAVAMTEAGEINITVNDTTLTEEPLTMGAIEYEADDGSIVAYQAGGVWRETGEDTQMLSPPPIHFRENPNTLSLPVTTVSDEQELTSGEVTIDHTDSEPLRNASFVEDDIVTLEITSEYYRGWELFFEEEVEGAAIREVNETLEGDLGYLEVELGIRDLEGVFDAGVAVNEAGGYDVGGNPDDVDGVQSGASYPPVDDVIYDLVEESSEDNETQNWSDSKEHMSNGTYFAEEDIIIDHELDVDLSDGNTTLVVNGSVTIDGGNLLVDPGETDNTFSIYSTGNLDMPSGNVETDGSGAKHIQVYGTSEMSTYITGDSFEGVIYSPSDDWDGSNELVPGDQCHIEGVGDAQACLQSDLDFTGSIVASSVYAIGGQGNLDFSWDSDLEGYEPDIYPEEYVLPPDITYLNVAVHEVNVEN